MNKDNVYDSIVLNGISIVFYNVVDSVGIARKVVTYSEPVDFEKLFELSRSDNVLIRTAIANSMGSPSCLLTLLAEDKEAIVRANVANNINTLPSVLDFLSQDEEIMVRKRVASNPRTPYSAFIKLLKMNDPIINMYLASNLMIPEKIVFKLLHYDNYIVNSCVALNEGLSDNVFEKLINNNVEVLFDLVKNPVLSDNILLKLANHSDPYIRFSVSLHVNSSIHTLFIVHSNTNNNVDGEHIINIICEKLVPLGFVKENCRNIFFEALSSDKRFNNLDDFVEAYSLTYGVDGLVDPMIGVDLYANYFV